MRKTRRITRAFMVISFGLSSPVDDTEVVPPQSKTAVLALLEGRALSRPGEKEGKGKDHAFALATPITLSGAPPDAVRLNSQAL